MYKSVTTEPSSQVSRLYRWSEPPTKGDCAEVELASNRQNSFVRIFASHLSPEGSIEQRILGARAKPSQIVAISEDRTFTAAVVREPSEQVRLDDACELIPSQIDHGDGLAPIRLAPIRLPFATYAPDGYNAPERALPSRIPIRGNDYGSGGCKNG